MTKPIVQTIRKAFRFFPEEGRKSFPILKEKMDICQILCKGFRKAFRLTLKITYLVGKKPTFEAIFKKSL